MQRFFILILIRCQKNKLAEAPVANDKKTFYRLFLWWKSKSSW